MKESKRRKILMLEDNQGDAAQIKHALEKYYDVVMVHTTEEARRKITHDLDCFLFDYDINGNKIGDKLLLEGMKNGTIRVPCLLMSQYNPGRDMKELGFFAFIDKTSHGWVDQLLATVQASMDRDTDSALAKMLESVGCLNDPWNIYDFKGVAYTPLEVHSLMIQAKTVRDLLKLSQDTEVSPGPRAHLREFLRGIYLTKQDQRFGRA